MGQFLQNIIDFFKRAITTNDAQYNKYVANEYADYSQFYNPNDYFTDEYYSNLIRTINWTQKIVDGIENKNQINYSTIFRSTNPDYEGKPFYRYYETGTSVATPEVGFNYLSVLTDALTVREDNSFAFEDIKQLGQILEFKIDLTTHDGAPCANSDDFVDESDIPPIDTWFYLTKNHLYCWIPNMFIEKMQAAIDVEIFDSYNWVKDSDPALYLQTIKKLKEGFNKGSANDQQQT